MHISGEKFVMSLGANYIKVTLCAKGGGGEKRGEVTGISRQSKTRLLDLLNSCVWESVKFVTLTYRRNETDPDEAYRALRRAHKRFCYEKGQTAWVWRREVQKRGAYHFHVFIFDCDFSKKYLADMWNECSDKAGGFHHRRYGTHVVDVGSLGPDDGGVLVSYLAKYASKDNASAGRAWGVLGGCALKKIQHKQDVSMSEATLLIDAIRTRGGVLVTDATCPVTSYKLYLGHLGQVANKDGLGVTRLIRELTGIDLLAGEISSTICP